MGSQSTHLSGPIPGVSAAPQVGPLTAARRRAATIVSAEVLPSSVRIGGRTSPPGNEAGRPSDHGPAQPACGDRFTRQCAAGADLYWTTPTPLTPSPGPIRRRPRGPAVFTGPP